MPMPIQDCRGARKFPRHPRDFRCPSRIAAPLAVTRMGKACRLPCLVSDHTSCASARPLFSRHRLDDQMSRARAWEISLSTYCRQGDEFENLRITQPAGAHEPDKPILLAASFKDFGRVRQ